MYQSTVSPLARNPSRPASSVQMDVRSTYVPRYSVPTVEWMPARQASPIPLSSSSLSARHPIRGRVALSGTWELYNNDSRPKAPAVQPTVQHRTCHPPRFENAIIAPLDPRYSPAMPADIRSFLGPKAVLRRLPSPRPSRRRRRQKMLLQDAEAVC